jgi:hypothetical protein
LIAASPVRKTDIELIVTHCDRTTALRKADHRRDSWCLVRSR